MKKSIILIILLAAFSFINSSNAQTFGNTPIANGVVNINWMDIVFEGYTIPCSNLVSEGSYITITMVPSSGPEKISTYDIYSSTMSQTFNYVSPPSGNWTISAVLTLFVAPEIAGDLHLYTVAGGVYHGEWNGLVNIPITVHAVGAGYNEL